MTTRQTSCFCQNRLSRWKITSPILPARTTAASTAILSTASHPSVSDEELASFLCVGSYSDEYSDYPETIVYSFNLNPKTGELYNLDELILDFSIIKEKFESGAFDYISGLENLLTLTNYSDMIVGYGDTYQLYPPIYFIAEENDFELALSVGLVYELGGHAEFSIDADLVSSALTETLLGMLK